MDEISALKAQLEETNRQLAQLRSDSARQVQAKANESQYLRTTYENDQLARLGQQSVQDDAGQDWFGSLFTKPQPASTTQAAAQTSSPQVVMTEEQFKQFTTLTMRKAREAAREEVEKKEKLKYDAEMTQQQLVQKFVQDEPEMAQNQHYTQVLNTIWHGAQAAMPGRDPQELYQLAVAQTKQIIENVKAGTPQPPPANPWAAPLHPYGGTEYNTLQQVPKPKADPIVTDVPGNQQPDWIQNLRAHNQERAHKFS